MNYYTNENLYYNLDKDILHYIEATEHDQWENFLLYD